jgi:hypothetical protein
MVEQAIYIYECGSGCLLAMQLAFLIPLKEEGCLDHLRVYQFLEKFCAMYITIAISDIIYRPVFYLKTQRGPI